MKNLIVIYLFTLLLACNQQPENEAQVVEDGVKKEEIKPVEEPIMPNNQPPMAEKRPHTFTQHGDERVDNYHWLRDDTP